MTVDVCVCTCVYVCVCVFEHILDGIGGGYMGMEGLCVFGTVQPAVHVHCRIAGTRDDGVIRWFSNMLERGGYTM